LRLVPPGADDGSYEGIREGDDGDFLFAIWAMAHEFAEESVGTLEANPIADRIMDAVGKRRHEGDPTFLDDPGKRRAYVLRAVVIEMRAAHRTNQQHAKLRTMYAQFIAENTTGRPLATPDSREAAELLEREMDGLARCVSRTVDALPHKCHEVVYLTYVEELAPREIAEILDIKPDSVHSHLKRAHAKVREAVRQYLIEHPREADT
jgi:RNA polymerase sigma factor (sigma-70 family)